VHCSRTWGAHFGRDLAIESSLRGASGCWSVKLEAGITIVDFFAVYQRSGW
jgi:hypothetical protein